MDLPIVNHLFVTSRFLVKGRVAVGENRLSTFLNASQRPLLHVEDFTLVELESGDRVVAASGQVRLNDVVFAHELVDVGGDHHRRQLAESEGAEPHMACFYLRPPISYELTGSIRTGAFEKADGPQFEVVQRPAFRNFDAREDRDLELLLTLPYVVLNRTQIHCMLTL